MHENFIAVHPWRNSVVPLRFCYMLCFFNLINPRNSMPTRWLGIKIKMLYHKTLLRVCRASTVPFFFRAECSHTASYIDIVININNCVWLMHDASKPKNTSLLENIRTSAALRIEQPQTSDVHVFPHFKDCSCVGLTLFQATMRNNKHTDDDVLYQMMVLAPR